MIHNSNSALKSTDLPPWEKKNQIVPKSIRTTEGSKHSGTNLHQENMWSY